jgi:DNA helicase-2/ATP-dependent DNA helicase PcrA
MNLENLYKWAQLKGISVLGTGDFTHPVWFSEIEKKLEPAEPGLFKLKKKYCTEMDKDIPKSCKNPVRFMLSVEISNIYKKNDKVRKVHSLIYSPDLASAGRLNKALDQTGNIKSDGRPIIGMHTKDLLQMALDSSEDNVLIPAHIWTPWFSVLGASSGFDSIEECFEDLTPHIFALETGLSSDPPMNWMISDLDRFVLVSNSDAHSPSKLAREANIFTCEMSYFEMMDTLRNKKKKGFAGTLEFFPEEG